MNMNLTFILVFCCVLSAFGRKFSDCELKRCCLALDTADREMSALCSSFGASDCIEGHSDQCQWDCDPKATRFREDGLKQHGFTKRGKSYYKTQKKQAKDIDLDEIEKLKIFRELEAKYFNDKATKKEIEIETVGDMIKYSQISSVDSCGIQTEWELDEIHAKILLDDKNKQKKSQKSHGAKSQNHPIRRLYVFGEDGRRQITNPYDHQWSGQLFTGLVDGDVHEVEFCSAAMISPTWLITAAHCVYSADGWRQGVEFHPGTVNTATFRANPPIHAKTMYVPTDYIERVRPEWTEYAAQFDVAWIELESAVGFEVGWLSLGSSTPSTEQIEVNVVGYPADKASHTHWTQLCRITDNTNMHMMKSSDCDTFGGSSGGAIYNGNDELIAVVSNHGPNDNGFRRITPTMKEIICGIMGWCPSEPYCTEKWLDYQNEYQCPDKCKGGPIRPMGTCSISTFDQKK